MNNLVVGIKKFFTNKNTVTVVGVILAIIIIYVGYNMRINQAITPVTVPYAMEDINPRTQITEDMVGTMEIPQSMVNDNIISNSADVIDMYSNYNSFIPEGSLFYSKSVVSRDQLPGNIILDYPKGYVLYNLDVDMASTYSNQIVPGNYIDIYLKVQNAEGAQGTAIAEDRIMVGKLLSNIKVLAVFDSSGNDVFANVEEKTAPAQIIFAVPEEYHILLRKAGFLRAYESEIIPVPTNESLEDEPGDVELSSEDLKNFINNVTAMTEEDLSYTQQ
ncbi:MAG TPA: hypothetical protein IAB59_01295 [Candidatus Onthousia faecipullorum]|uniref:Flp pilus assembly protein CpaB n=1 Tax=Candidatus Onthousia faecipullorum TaxID=2840887 RepID=A0A9D1G9X8_9FIRM|nr:hypothetical protein [Candidatus Onthousia faecipullorum]